MEEWIKVIAPLIGIAGLWWKLTTSMATKAELTAVKTDLGSEINEVKADVVSVRAELKADMAELKAELKAGIGSVRSDMTDLKADLKAENAEMRADIREIRQLLYKNVVGSGGEDNNGKKGVGGN